MPPKKRKANAQSTRSGKRSTRERTVRIPARYAVSADSDDDTTPPQPGRSDNNTSDPMLKALTEMQQVMLQQQEQFNNSLAALQTSLQAIAQHLPPTGPPQTQAQRTTGTPSSTYTPAAAQSSPHAPTQGDPAQASTASGESFPISKNAQTPHRPVQVAGTPIGMNVKASLKERIWAHQFIDLTELLYPNQAAGYMLSIQDPGGEQPSFSLAPKKRQQLSEGEWSRAMDIFVAVYTQRYPNEIGDILTYCQQVKELMSMGGHWRYFDQTFRADREFTKCSWLDFRPDLENKALLKAIQEKTANFSQRKNQQPFRPQPGRIPPGYCFAFHQPGERCRNDRCSYKHTCRDCGRQHPMFLSCRGDKPTTRASLCDL